MKSSKIKKNTKNILSYSFEYYIMNFISVIAVFYYDSNYSAQAESLADEAV